MLNPVLWLLLQQYFGKSTVVITLKYCSTPAGVLPHGRTRKCQLDRC